MPTILQRQAQLVAEFDALPDWEARYQRIIQRARDLPAMPDALKSDDNKVRGCASTVWLHAAPVDGRVVYIADGDAILVKGLIEILLSVYSGHTPDEILAAPPAFIEELGLNAHLSPNRANGLGAMVRQIMAYAAAFRGRAGSTGQARDG